MALCEAGSVVGFNLSPNTISQDFSLLRFLVRNNRFFPGAIISDIQLVIFFTGLPLQNRRIFASHPPPFCFIHA